MARSLARIDNEIFQAIWNKAKETKPKITDRAIRYRIQAVRKKFGKTISPGMAANILAAKMGVDVYKILKDNEELKQLRNLLRTTQPQVIGETRKERKRKKEQQIIIKKKIVKTFGLPQNLAKEAERMADVYPNMYVFENLIRRVVMNVLAKKHGKNWWNQPKVVSNDIKREVRRRKQVERKNRWHVRRGSHEIFYTDFSDLNRIITTNYNEFKDILADSEIQSHMRQLEHSRNIIAHNNPLPAREVERVKMYLEDLRKQLSVYVESQARKNQE